MRTFIAIEIPAAIKTELTKLQAELRRTGADVGWTNPNNIHLTLRFLGEIEEVRLTELKRLCAEIATQFQPFTLRLKDTGCFPNFKQPRVLWVGLAGEISIAQELQQRLEAGLTALGFDPEDKPFKPHLTIGRVKSGKNIRQLVAKSDMYPLPELSFAVGEIVVLKSELHPAGARYTPQAKVKLGD
ncbi:MAG: RNA 2',3'-cyclic phosphodiesterase [Acidobacteria bacterium]|nr:RNA 2',3'-cyclic phosphodiesterase [Acidobacteriota bacterium]